MGGEIGVQSNLDGGSTFWFTVVLGRPREEALPTQAKGFAGTSARSRSRKGFRILVAEDNKVNRLVALRELEYLGYQATAVKDGTEVLKALEQDQYDLILMDCQMPRLDGFETTGQIRAGESDTSRIPIIAVTAYAMQENVNKCLTAGMDDYISKPFNTAQLQRVVDRWLSIQTSGSEVGKSAQEVRHDPQRGVNLRALQRLQEIAGDAGEETVEAIVEAFLDQLPDFLENFHQQRLLCNTDGLRKTAHSLCGSSSTVGAFHLSDLCRRLGETLRTEGLGAAGELLEATFAEIEVVQADLRAEIEQTDSSAG
jgi:CheY-like chemotaxis protein/HPt (histidine-containing phosphotransfer) domain-containing protein